MDYLKSFKSFESVKFEFDGGVEYGNDKGELHREDGPAIEYGPAVEFSDGSKVWYLNGIFISETQFIKRLTNHPPNPNLFIDLPVEDLEEISNDLCDKYLGEVKQWCNFYAIYFKEKLDPNDPDLKSFKNRMGDFRIRINNKSIIVY